MMNEKDYYELPEETLVNLTLLDENRAFEALVLRFQKAVTASAYSVTRNASLTEDIVQDTFVTSWLKLNTLKEPQKFGAWVCNIARNKAKNLVIKYREYISFDLLENVKSEHSENLEDLFFPKHDNLYVIIDGLSDKLKDVINLHYFENASVNEISAKLNLSSGTVKWRLHEGRKKIREGLGYNMESNNKTVKSILEKVNKFIIKWRTRDGKDGFETDYNNMMTELEQIPDENEKYYNMAEVMQLGFWWIPGKDNDEMIEKIREAAEKGKNTEVLGELWKREADKYHGDEKTDYIINTLIPKMENAGMTDAVGWEWFWLGYEYFSKKNKEAGYAAYNKVMEILPKHHVYYANAIAAIRMEKLAENVENAEENGLCAGATGEELLIDDGKLYFYKQPGYSRGTLYDKIPALFYHASRCDGTLYDSNLKVGESIKSYNGKTELIFASADAEIETSCGKFDGCELWVTVNASFKTSVYYKRGIGIVYILFEENGKKRYCSLKKYNIAGGDGLIPFCEGNRWEYDSGFSSKGEIIYEVISFNGSEAIIAAHNFGTAEYLPDNWNDMMLKMRHEYWRYDGDNHEIQKLKDVSFPIERAKILAKTLYQKIHTASAVDVMKHIFDGDEDITPESKFTGHWNFFHCWNVNLNDGKTKIYDDRQYSFEWKDMSDTHEEGYQILGNHILGIFQDAVGCIWDEEFKPGFSSEMKGDAYKKTLTKVNVENAGTVEVAVGRFEDCLKITLGITDGWDYRTGTKAYYFAKGVGLIKCEHYIGSNNYIGDNKEAVYELTSYEKTGEGYMPVEDGLFRRYELINAREDYIGKTEYIFCNDDDGHLKIIESNIGIRTKKIYSPDNWEDMILQMRNECRINGVPGFQDMSFQMERAQILAKTPYQKIHTVNAVDVMKRMVDRDKNKDKYVAYDNYFNCFRLTLNNGKICTNNNYRKYEFGQQSNDFYNSGDEQYYLMANSFMEFLNDMTHCIWDDKWQAGTSFTISDTWIKANTDITVEQCDSMEVAAGKFDDCLKITFDAKNIEADNWLGDYIKYVKAKKEYYFAKGIGIIKSVNYFKDGELVTVNELTSYEGMGDGYMPVKDGLIRRYSTMGLSDDFVSKTELIFCNNNDGEPKMIKNHTGFKIKQ